MSREIADLRVAQAATTEQIKALTGNVQTLTKNVGGIGDTIIEMMKLQSGQGENMKAQAENIKTLMDALKWTVAVIVGAVLLAGLEFVLRGGAHALKAAG